MIQIVQAGKDQENGRKVDGLFSGSDVERAIHGICRNFTEADWKCEIKL